MSATTPAVNSPLLSMNGGTTPSVICVTTTNATIASTSDISLFSGTQPTGTTQTIPANGAYAGNTYRILCRGLYTTPLVSAGTATFKVKWGSTVLASVTTATLTASATNFPFELDVLLTIRTTGSTGSIMCTGHVECATALTGVSTVFNNLSIGSVATIDTTVNSVLDATMSFSSIAGSQTASCMTGSIEILF